VDEALGLLAALIANWWKKGKLQQNREWVC
jgi:hypothetical protein